MVKSDRFLVGILTGLGLLVALALAIALAGQPADYQPDGDPTHAVRNYLLALEKGDYERAFREISPTVINRPANPNALEESILECHYTFTDLARETSSQFTLLSQDGRSASVRVQQLIYERSDPFDDGQRRSTFVIKLEREDAGWKIIHGDKYWCICWSMPDRCP